jgi:hypothetical protein
MNTPQLSKLQDMVSQFYQSQLSPKNLNSAPPRGGVTTQPYSPSQNLPQGPNRPPGMSGGMPMQTGAQGPIYQNPNSIPVMNPSASDAMRAVREKIQSISNPQQAAMMPPTGQMGQDYTGSAPGQNPNHVGMYNYLNRMKGEVNAFNHSGITDPLMVEEFQKKQRLYDSLVNTALGQTPQGHKPLIGRLSDAERPQSVPAQATQPVPAPAPQQTGEVPQAVQPNPFRPQHGANMPDIQHFLQQAMQMGINPQLTYRFLLHKIGTPRNPNQPVGRGQ